MDMGVASFKVEGRLKSPEYVAAAARAYRSAIDRHSVRHDLSPIEVEAAKRRMATTYSRGFFTGWLKGVDHQHLVDGVSKSHRGLEIGRLHSGDANSMVIELVEGGEASTDIELSPGDGLLWTVDHADQGAQVYKVDRLDATRVRVEFANDVEVTADSRGARVYLNHDSSQKRDLRRTFHDKNAWKRIPVEVTVDIELGLRLNATMSDGTFTVTAEGRSPIEAARNKAVTDEFLADELGALGGSVFKLSDFTVRRASPDPIFYPHKELKEIRRELTERLEKLRRENRIRRDDGAVAPARDVLAWNRERMQPRQTTSGSGSETPAGTRLNVLLREKAQVTDLIEAVSSSGRLHGDGLRGDDLGCVILDFEFGQDYESSVAGLKNAGLRCGIATTRSS
ncbi:MAG: hypothetical protein HC902_01040 [Calothrix sp. SM1_5_4]|nr:hypothetical protein [Calothrix sp. SM1_5_4]